MSVQRGVFVVGFTGEGIFAFQIAADGVGVDPRSVHQEAERRSGFKIDRLDELDTRKLGLGAETPWKPMIATGCRAHSNPLHPMQPNDFLSLVKRDEFPGLRYQSRLWEELSGHSPEGISERFCIGDRRFERSLDDVTV